MNSMSCCPAFACLISSPHSITFTSAFTPIFARSACSSSAPAFGFGFSTLPVGRTQIVVSKPFGNPASASSFFAFAASNGYAGIDLS